MAITYLTNALSLNMLTEGFEEAVFKISEISPDIASGILQEADGVLNAIGHVDTDNLIRNMLNWPVMPMGIRHDVKVKSGDTLVVAQYSGPRLPEGAKSLPSGAKIKFFLVEVD